MPDLVVLRDADIHDMLMNLSRQNVLEFRTAIEKALGDFSTPGERECQPDPVVAIRPNGAKTLFRTFTSGGGPGVKIVQHPPRHASPNSTLHGVIAACDEDGRATGLMNADSITAYRTAMSAMIPYAWRSNTSNVLLFGSGKTALWHLRLILSLRGHEVQRITVINRTSERARTLVEDIKAENQRLWRSSADLHVLDPKSQDYDSQFRHALSNADAIFCTTGSKAPLFMADHLSLTPNNARNCFISSIGSWQPEIIELDPAILIAAGHSGKSRVIVDHKEKCLEESGEIQQSGLGPNDVIEIGELLCATQEESPHVADRLKHDYGSGILVYKSVGVGLTDLAAANLMFEFALRQGKGTIIPDV